MAWGTDMQDVRKVLRTGFEHLALEFRQGIVGNYPALEEFKGRSVARSIVVAPNRMIDLANEIMQQVYKGRPDGSKPPIDVTLPLMAFAFDRNMELYRPEFGQRVMRKNIILPDDPEQRTFSLKVSRYLCRMQMVIYAADDSTCHELARQYVDFVLEKFRRVNLEYSYLGGIPLKLWCNLSDKDIFPISADSGIKNISAIAVDTTWKVPVPELRGKDGGLIDKDTDPTVEQGVDLIVRALLYGHDAETLDGLEVLLKEKGAP